MVMGLGERSVCLSLWGTGILVLQEHESTGRQSVCSGASPGQNRNQACALIFEMPMVLPPPPPSPKFLLWVKMKFAEGQICLGQFWYTNFWVPDPPPPPLSSTHRPDRNGERLTTNHQEVWGKMKEFSR